MTRSPVCPPAPVVEVAEEDIIVVQQQQEQEVVTTTTSVTEEEEDPVAASPVAAVENAVEEEEVCAASMEQEEMVALEAPVLPEEGVDDNVEPVSESSSSLSPMRRAVESRRKSVSRLSLSMAAAEVADTTADVEASSAASPVPAPSAVVVVCRDTQRLFNKERQRPDRRASSSASSHSRESANARQSFGTTTQKRKSIAAPHFRSVAREVAPVSAPATTEACEEEGDRVEEEVLEGDEAIAMVESSEPMVSAERFDHVEVDEEVVVTGSQVAAPSDILEASSSSDEMVITTTTTTITTIISSIKSATI